MSIFNFCQILFVIFERGRADMKSHKPYMPCQFADISAHHSRSVKWVFRILLLYCVFITHFVIYHVGLY